MIRRPLLATCLTLSLAACSDDAPFLPFDGDAFVSDAGRDIGADISVDAGGDTAPDTSADAGDDAVQDTGSDIGADVAPDTIEVPGILDPGCTDGQFSETLPDPSADIGAQIAAYSEEAVVDFIIDTLEVRYPTGAYLVEEGLRDTSFIDCVDFFLRDTSSAAEVIRQFSTLVHECGHVADIADRRNDLFIINENLRFVCPAGGDTTDRGGNTFARSLLTTDAYASLRPPCDGASDGTCDFYADIYLNGNPFDAEFESGDQGFNLLMEEAVQYVNSLATGYAFEDQFPFLVSERDGILTFLWYIERYLYLARTEYPDAYSYIIGSECYRDLILTTWGRGWQYLELTAESTNLGINDDVLEEYVRAEELLAEIELVRAAAGCE